MNEIQLYFGSLKLDSTNNITVSNVEVKEKKTVHTTKIPKTDGSIAELGRRESLQISVSGDIAGTDYDDLRTNIDTLRAGLQNGLQSFTTDDDRTLRAQLVSFDFSYVVMRRLATWKATFSAHYPFWLGAEATDTRTPTSGVGYVINNAGNAPTRVKVEITAPAGGLADDIQLENTTVGELFKFRGTVAAAKVLEIDNRYDTDDYQVLNDSVDAHTNFEGDFLTLDPGNNTIEFTGGADTSVKLTYKPAYY